MDKTKVLSGFSGASTAEEVIQGIDLTGKIALVTGGYAGIGLETTRVLHAAGARIIIPARDLRKAEAALQGLEGVVNSAGIMAPPLVRCATSPQLDTFYPYAIDPEAAERLWVLSERLTGAQTVA